MKRLVLTAALGAMTIGAAPVYAEGFTGDVRLACEPSLHRYFGITAKKLSDTLTKRRNFLNLCPAANSAASLNASLRVWRNDEYSYNDGKPQTYIRNAMPAHCTAYGGNAYTDKTNPVIARYVGTPERGGFWADAASYSTALAEYNARIAAEDANYGRWGRNRNQWYGGSDY